MKVFDEGLIVRKKYEQNKGKHFAILLLIMIATIIIDLATKLIFTDQYFSLIENVFSVHFVRNYGGAMGVFSGNYLLLLSIPIIIVIGLTITSFFLTYKTYSYTIGMGFIFGGAIGNIADRLFLGSVRDIISIDFLSFTQPVFNMADLFLTIGVFFLAYYALIVLTKIIFDNERMEMRLKKEQFEIMQKRQADKANTKQD